ncbi:rotamase-domain-containing protein [Nadsonia fulvescens var. elongata DSM 6958]|uniref:Peptidyl-prolyl cis-trans isomerase n=1 Tax=Nadsonia fulvescens var. elongata DSM 6958 TaxID=857566 RepID=A0A1E3PF59_9ASCO|nr:rotamase-domain-containing protein [Nadsonia fulvescens var. elongata DSM 6958]
MSTSSNTGLIANWEIRHSRSRNLPYYFNSVTGESSWEPPFGSDTTKLQHYMATQYSGSAQSGNNNTGGGQSIGADASSTSSSGVPTKVRASHLLIKHRDSRRPSSWKESNITRTKDESRAILLAHEARIRSGQITLGQLASTESDCSSARKGGDLGAFGRGEMQKEFEDAAFSLKVGEISSIVETGSGLHLIERTA